MQNKEDKHKRRRLFEAYVENESSPQCQGEEHHPIKISNKRKPVKKAFEEEKVEVGR
jgi:hypothetical protein